MKENISAVAIATYPSLTAVAILIASLGSLLNGFTLATLIKQYKPLQVQNIIMFSMMISDFIMSSTAMPLNIHANIMKRWPFGVEGCEAYGFITSLCGLASMNHLAGAAFQRYDTIDRGTRGRSFLNERRAVYFVIFLWFYSFVFSVAPLVNWSSYTIEGVGTSCAVDWSSSNPTAVSYTVVLFNFCFFLPLAIIVFSYYRVYKAVQLMRINANQIWGNLSATAAETLKTEKKMAGLVFIMIGAFLISWVPYAVVSLISATGNRHLIGPLGASVPAYIAKSSCIYNPILYFFMFKSCRIKMIAMFPSVACCKHFSRRNRVLPTVLQKANGNDTCVTKAAKNEIALRFANDAEKTRREETSVIVA